MRQCIYPQSGNSFGAYLIFALAPAELSIVSPYFRLPSPFVMGERLGTLSVPWGVPDLCSPPCGIEYCVTEISRGLARKRACPLI